MWATVAVAQNQTVGQRTGIGSNLAGVASIVTQWDFVDLMKGSNPWVYEGGPNAGQPTPVDSLGNPLLLPGEKANTLLRLKIVNSTQNRVPDYPVGQYAIAWEGTGSVYLTGDGDSESIIAAGPGSRTFQAASGAETLFMRVESTSAADPLRNVRVYMPDYAPGEAKGGQRYHQTFLDRSVLPFGATRFMDWGRVNDSKLANWSERTRDGANQYAIAGGVPVEEQLRLVNASNGDAWFCMPAHATDEFVTKFARSVLYGVDAAGEPYASPQSNPFVAPIATDRKIYVEYANEAWNQNFEGFRYITQQALAAGLHPQGLNQDFAKQWAAEARRDFDQWTREFSAAGQLERLRRVAAVQTVNRFVSPLFLKELVSDGVPQFDVISPAFYMGVDSGAYGAATTKDDIIDDLRTSLASSVDPAITTTFPGTPFEIVGPRGDWLLWKQFADQYGAELVAYEGGQGVTAPDVNVPWYDDYVRSQRDARMFDLYSDWLSAIFDDVNADGVNIFSSVGLISQYGAWGHLEYQDQPDADAPKYRAIVEFSKRRGDFDLNGWYNAADVQLLENAFGSTPTGENAMFDLTRDGAINNDDLQFFIRERVQTVPADFDLNGSVDTADLSQWASGFGAAGGLLQGDANGDQRVNGADFLVWQRMRTPAGTATTAHVVPEPSGSSLALASLSLLIGGRYGSSCRNHLVDVRRPLAVEELASAWMTL